jgi:hypothetical protein
MAEAKFKKGDRVAVDHRLGELTGVVTSVSEDGQTVRVLFDGSGDDDSGVETRRLRHITPADPERAEKAERLAPPVRPGPPIKAEVNLWELITTVSNEANDLPNQDKCEAIKNMKGPRFGSELTLAIDEYGVWTVVVFNHDDSSQYVQTSIAPSGRVTVTRGRDIDDIREERSISF